MKKNENLIVYGLVTAAIAIALTFTSSTLYLFGQQPIKDRKQPLDLEDWRLLLTLRTRRP